MSNVLLDHDFHSEEMVQLSDTREGDDMARLPVEPPPIGDKDCGLQRPGKRKRAVTLDDRPGGALPEGLQSPSSRGESQVSTSDVYPTRTRIVTAFIPERTPTQALDKSEALGTSPFDRFQGPGQGRYSLDRHHGTNTCGVIVSGDWVRLGECTSDVQLIASRVSQTVHRNNTLQPLSATTPQLRETCTRVVHISRPLHIVTTLDR